ncbi:hypothetical protein [Tunicatimonas pelagia]|uniref:hypothetical protein n=1 Tax=Tunicatimonas pelagia TaxID=931531 RepID=UPI0026654242|nr:hypothetical protein [Tunicatimonas pelagia]WKN46164.1 hypothetical protein P0M28_14515 [Tunicatimonas pelagia]
MDDRKKVTRRFIEVYEHLKDSHLVKDKNSFAKTLGISNSAITNVFSGARDVPLGHLIQLFKFFPVDARFVFQDVMKASQNESYGGVISGLYGDIILKEPEKLIYPTNSEERQQISDLRKELADCKQQKEVLLGKIEAYRDSIRLRTEPPDMKEGA